MNQTEIQETEQVLSELQAEAHTTEDHAELEKWQTELDAQRQEVSEALGQGAMMGAELKLVQLPDGSIATASEVAQIEESGNQSTTYKGGRRA